MRLLLVFILSIIESHTNVFQNQVETKYVTIPAYLFIGRGKFNLPVNAAWSKKCRVQNVNTVCCHNNLRGKKNIFSKLRLSLKKTIKVQLQPSTEIV